MAFLIFNKMKIEWIEKHMTEAEKMISEGDQLDLGLGILNNLLYEEPGYGRLHNHIGWAHLYFTEDLLKAELHLKTAIKFDAEFPAPYIHLGKLYTDEEKYDDAIEVLAEGVKQPQANKAVMFDMIGKAFEMQKEYKDAIKAYREAMLASADSYRTNQSSEGIRRCRKKRWSSIFN
jgi:tetratricopeptide (TPR) repeat protein